MKEALRNMEFEDLLNGFLKTPKTKEEAKEYIKNFPGVKAGVEEAAFRRTVTNALILSGLITENDFDASVRHFEEELYDELADELLAAVGELEKAEEAEPEETGLPDDDEEDWSDGKEIAKA